MTKIIYCLNFNQRSLCVNQNAKKLNLTCFEYKSIFSLKEEQNSLQIAECKKVNGNDL